MNKARRLSSEDRSWLAGAGCWLVGAVSGAGCGGVRRERTKTGEGWGGRGGDGEGGGRCLLGLLGL